MRVESKAFLCTLVDESRHFFACSYVPNLDSRRLPDKNVFPVYAELCIVSTADDPFQVPSRHVPQLRGAVVTHSCEASSIVTERHMNDVLGLIVEHRNANDMLY